MNQRRGTTVNGQRYAWIGYAMGLACMAALLIAGIVMGKPPMMVMAGTMAVLLGAVWSSTSLAARKAAARPSSDREVA